MNADFDCWYEVIKKGFILYKFLNYAKCLDFSFPFPFHFFFAVRSMKCIINVVFWKSSWNHTLAHHKTKTRVERIG